MIVQDPPSPREYFKTLPKDEQARRLADLNEADQASLDWDWPLQRRLKQATPPGDWRTWLILSGRGFGKTRVGAEWVRERLEAGTRLVSIIAPTANDLRKTIVDDVGATGSGLLDVFPPNDLAPAIRRLGRPQYEPSNMRLVWPNGAVANLYSGSEPERLRGAQSEAVWIDELAAMRYANYVHEMATYGLRLGNDPRMVITTTPRPIPLLKRIMRDPTTVVTRGTTYENAANLAPQFLQSLVSRYEGTRSGRQELHAEFLEDVPGALWTLGGLDQYRLLEPVPRERLVRIVVAIDPPAKSADTVATEDLTEISECGIIVAGIDAASHGYVLEDASRHAAPLQWAALAVSLYMDYEADRIVVEQNMGGEMVETTLRTVDRRVPIRLVTATRGKLTRAEPISALAEQGKIHLVGSFPELEGQLTSWVPGKPSPDRLDAMVWALTDLMLGVARAPVALV